MRFAAIGLVVVTLAAAVGLAPTGNAAVRKPAPLRLSCDPYIRFEQRCHCGGAQGYFLGYGLKYCERSLAETGWTPAGARWRDRTLLCLQRALSAAMPRERAQHCDCQALRNYAFESHVSCYTQPPTSICHL